MAKSLSEDARSRLEKPEEAWGTQKGFGMGKEVRDQQPEEKIGKSG